MGKGGSDVQYTPPPPTSQEVELQNILLNEARQRASQDTLRQDLTSKFLSSDFSTGALTPEETARLNNITSTYTDVRTKPLVEQANIAERNLRQRFASQGILDSSVASDAAIQQEKELGKQISNVGQEASLFRYGAEGDIRKAALAENLAKIGVINQATDPSIAYNALAALTGQRTQESNQALQIALANAQNGGGFLNFLNPRNLLGPLGASAGFVVGGPFGAVLGQSAGTHLAGATRF